MSKKYTIKPGRVFSCDYSNSDLRKYDFSNKNLDNVTFNSFKWCSVLPSHFNNPVL